MDKNVTPCFWCRLYLPAGMALWCIFKRASFKANEIIWFMCNQIGSMRDQRTFDAHALEQESRGIELMKAQDEIRNLQTSAESTLTQYLRIVNLSKLLLNLNFILCPRSLVLQHIFRRPHGAAAVVVRIPITRYTMEWKAWLVEFIWFDLISFHSIWFDPWSKWIVPRIS